MLPKRIRANITFSGLNLKFILSIAKQEKLFGFESI